MEGALTEEEKRIIERYNKRKEYEKNYRKKRYLTGVDKEYYKNYYEKNKERIKQQSKDNYRKRKLEEQAVLKQVV